MKTRVLPIPIGLNRCSALQSLQFSDLASEALNALMDGSYGPAVFPDLERLSITSNILEWPADPESEEAKMFLCSRSSNLKHLALWGVGFRHLPSCVDQFAQLEKLEYYLPLNHDSFQLANFSQTVGKLITVLEAIGTESSDWDKLVTQFPNLKSLEVMAQSAFELPFPGSELSKLQDLEELTMTSFPLTGQLPSDFFDKLAQLKVLRLAENALSGPLPTYGWQNLQVVDLAGNQFSDWPYLYSPGAKNLVELTLNGNPLQSIPNDETFSEMTKLRKFMAAYAPNLRVRLPTFWANGSHKLRSFSADGSGFVGTLPSSIASPYLKILSVPDNDLCGPLPEVSGAMSLLLLNLAGNQFSGSMPISWGQNLIIEHLFLVQRNLLQGTLPDPFLHPHSAAHTINLQDNYLTGPFPNMSDYHSLTTLYANGVNMTIAWCAANPDWRNSVTCSLQLEPSICRCTAFWEACQVDFLDAGCEAAPDGLVPIGTAPPDTPFEVTPIIPSSITCATPPESGPAPPVASSQPTTRVPPPPPSCPLPSPGPTFFCVAGTWTSTDSVTQPTLVIPSGSTVVIGGNLTLSGGISFNGLDSQLTVNGCIYLGDGNEVTIELTKEELKQLEKEGKVSKTLLTYNGADCTGGSDLTGTKVIATKGSGSEKCRKLNASNSGSTPATLVVAFTVDSGSCNTKWIILGSVLGGVIVLAVIGVVLIVTFSSKAKALIRPFSTRKTV
jgi:Leucine-rich repeat (LRR) protein